MIPQSSGPPAAGSVTPIETARTPPAPAPPVPVAAETEAAPEPVRAPVPEPLPAPLPEVAATPPPKRDAQEEEAWESTAREAAPTTRIESHYEAGDPGDYRLGVEPLTDPRLAPTTPIVEGEPVAVAEVEPISASIDAPPPSDPALAVPAPPSGELGFSFADWFGHSP